MTRSRKRDHHDRENEGAERHADRLSWRPLGSGANAFLIRSRTELTLVKGARRRCAIGALRLTGINEEAVSSWLF
jgi:hypothetical protein